MEISNSDKGSFLRCRRQWDFVSHNRQGLRSIHPPRDYFLIGSIFHRVLDAQAKGDDPYEIIDREMNDEIAEAEEGYRQIVGVGYSEVELEAANKSRELIRGMVTNYFDRYGSNPIGPQYRYVHTEVPWRLPIPDTDGFMRGTFDGLAQDQETGDLWVVEHKTFSQSPNIETLMVDDQLTCYVWAAQNIANVPVLGVLYDGTRKKLPTEPELLKNGSMSKRWIETTEEVYRRALVEYGLEERDYEDFLMKLRERDQQPQNPFFTRYKIPIPPSAVRAYEESLTSIYKDMSDPGLRIYPTRPWNGCHDCSMKAVCDAMTYDEDVEYLLGTYWKGPAYRTFQLEPLSEIKLDL